MATELISFPSNATNELGFAFIFGNELILEYFPYMYWRERDRRWVVTLCLYHIWNPLRRHVALELINYEIKPSQQGSQPNERLR